MKCSAPKFVDDPYDEDRSIAVGCGKCIPCLIAARQEWCFRLEQEHKYSASAHFVTLTYDQRHLPSDGKLDKSHLQKYLKRLRKRDGSNKIRFYGVGEYGSRSGRPHYHLLVFNAQESDIRKSWADSKGKPVGIVHVGVVSAASVAYCTKYIVQPQTAGFRLMSRRYGIGGRYLTDVMVAWHKEDNRNYAIRDGVKVRLSRFYKSKIWYKESEKQKVAEVSRIRSVGETAKQELLFEKKFGQDWKLRQAEMRNAVIRRVKKKVAYTQTI